jgi:hypothetical protein
MTIDQGDLHPKLEVPRLTRIGLEPNLGSTLGGERSSKELFEQQFGTSTYEPVTIIYLYKICKILPHTVPVLKSHLGLTEPLFQGQKIKKGD